VTERLWHLILEKKAPLAAHKDMYLDDNGNIIPNKSLTGIFSVGVPGSVDGMWTLHREKGRLPWYQLIQPAIDLARHGVTLTANEAKHMNEYATIIDSVSGFNTDYSKKKWK
jgi:gamma-glutamyltranspeptidase/glutathione hydrolase